MDLAAEHEGKQGCNLGASLVADLAGRIDGHIGRALDEALSRAPARDDPVVRLVYRSIYDYLANGGRRMHGGSVVLAYQACAARRGHAVGAMDDIDDVLPVAAAFQLYHYHTLVHDDIYDEDDRRRGSATVHCAFADWFSARDNGTPASLERPTQLFRTTTGRRGAIVGFAQGKVVHALALECLMSAAAFPAAEVLAVARRLNLHDMDDNAGQVLDVAREHFGAGELSPDDALRVAAMKTGRLFRVGAESAAALAGANPSRRAALGDWAELVAVAYQLKDDVEDLEPSSEKGAGRGTGSDLRMGKPTVLRAEALRRAEPGHVATLRACARGDVSPDRAAEVIVGSGSLRACLERIAQLVREADTALDSADPAFAPGAIRRLRAFAGHFLSHDYWRRPLPPPRDPLSANPGSGMTCWP
jgi:geranylgeranyl pyrophosphate synthase